MSIKPVVPRLSARRDLEEAFDYYLQQAGERVAIRFTDAAQAVMRSIGQTPGAGSSRYAHELNLPGLRHRQLRRFPYLVFYVERDDHIDVWRVLHGRRDIPVWLHEPVDP